jgi:threonine/homoserine/homoserine lactone efflux protein
VADQVDLSTTRVRTDDWPAQATDTIVKVVGTASDKVTGPVTTAARALVFGLFAAILGTAVITLVSILAVRIANNYLPDAWLGEEHVWAAHLLIGLVFSGFGLWLWTRRKPKISEE